MSPLEIQIALHYHCTREDYRELTPPAQQSIIKKFMAQGFLTKLPDGIDHFDMTYFPTDKLHAYCEALCKVPEPKQVWIIPTPNRSVDQE